MKQVCALAGMSLCIALLGACSPPGGSDASPDAMRANLDLPYIGLDPTPGEMHDLIARVREEARFVDPLGNRLDAVTLEPLSDEEVTCSLSTVVEGALDCRLKVGQVDEASADGDYSGWSAFYSLTVARDKAQTLQLAHPQITYAYAG